MKKRMEQLEFMVDLNWKMRFNKLDKIFDDPKISDKLHKFLETEVGKNWLNSENGKRYLEWQMS